MGSAPKKQYTCGLKKCDNGLTGGAKVGFENSEGMIEEVIVCGPHAYKIMTAPRGTFRISDDRNLLPIPAKSFIL